MVNLVGKNCPFPETSLDQDRKCVTDNEEHGVTPAAIIKATHSGEYIPTSDA